MRKNYQKNKKIKGSALAYGMIILFAVSIILVSILQFVVAQMKYSIRTTTKEQSFQIAEAGVYFYRWYLAHETSTLNQKQLSEFWAGDVLGKDDNYEVEFPQGSPIGKYRIEVVVPEADSTIVTVKSTGWTYKESDLKREVQVRFRKPSWSEYAVVTDSDIRFGEGTTINGKIHSNGGIRFDGVAQNLITSLKETYDDPDHSGDPEFGVHTHKDVIDPLPPASVPVRSDVFEAGRQFPVTEVSFTGFSEDNEFMKEEAQSGLGGDGCTSNGCYFSDRGNRDNGKRIIFRTDGTFDLCTVRTYDSSSYSISRYLKNIGNKGCNNCDGDCLMTYDIPDDGIIFVENNVWIEGQIDNKKVTVVASDNSEVNPASYGKDIYIGENNLRYSSYDGSDIIGLVAQRNISVVENSESTLTIDAALLAQNGRVGRNYYSGSCKSSITVNGAIATKKRYGFAYTGSNCSCSGYSVGDGYCVRNLNFDNDLLYYPPPYFPTGDAYAIDLWEEL